MEINRIYSKLENFLEKGEVLLLFGPRRVGKTTILKNFLASSNKKTAYYIGDDINTRDVLSSEDLVRLKELVEGKDIIVIDDAQRIPRIGWNLKLLVDNVPGIQVIATGSSSFELAGQVGDPLTGRKKSLLLYPLSQLELKEIYSFYELKQGLEQYLIYGAYPRIITSKTKAQKKEELEELVNAYLLKDIFELDKVKNSGILLDLLRMIAFQVGSEVSLSELASNLGIDIKTVQRYLDLFEKSYVLYNLRGYSRNLRSEITKKSKYYFLDNGIRNAVISNFNDLYLRNDIGQLWENFMISERLKKQAYSKIYSNNYFWRTWEQQEVDLIEEREGKLFAYEFKYSPKKTVKVPSQLSENYSNIEFKVIDNENYLSFIA